MPLLILYMTCRPVVKDVQLSPDYIHLEPLTLVSPNRLHLDISYLGYLGYLCQV